AIARRVGAISAGGAAAAWVCGTTVISTARRRRWARIPLRARRQLGLCFGRLFIRRLRLSRLLGHRGVRRRVSPRRLAGAGTTRFAIAFDNISAGASIDLVFPGTPVENIIAPAAKN